MAHWYDSEGKLHAYVPNKSKPGQFRDATLREARPNLWFPSSTTILGMLNKPTLNDWRVAQAVKQAINGNYDFTSPDIDVVKLITKESEEYVNWAASFGTLVHLNIANLWTQTTQEYSDELDRMVQTQDQKQAELVAVATHLWMLENGFECSEQERPFVNIELGYGGTIDFPGYRYGDNCIADYKTQDFDDIGKINWYEEWPLQLGSYALGIGHPEYPRYTICTSRTNPGLVAIKEYPHAEWHEFAQMWKLPNSDLAFLALLEAWRYLRGYDPRIGHQVVEIVDDLMQGELEIEL